MNIIFMGTPEFSVNCLKALLHSEHKVLAIYTQPDKPKGRKYILTAPPVKTLGLEYDIPIYQPKSFKDDTVINAIKDINPDAIVVVAYGKILPKSVLNIPQYGCINVHASLLPKYRGSAPIQWSIINGEDKTGITTMYMDKGLDTGDMLLKEETIIGQNETSGQLHDRLSLIGSDLLLKTLEEIKCNNIKREKQIDKDSCYSPMITKKDALINWENSAHDIHNFIRGMNPWPVAYTKLNEKTLKIYSSRIVQSQKTSPSIVMSNSPLIIGCGENTAIEVIEIQLEGKKRMKAVDFLKGHKIDIGSKLG